MKKNYFLLALLFIVSMSFVNAQNLVHKSLKEVAFDKAVKANHPATRSELMLTYLNEDLEVSSVGGYNLPVGTAYCSACITFSAGQISNYVDDVLHTIAVAVPPQYINGSTPCMTNLSGYKIWIKTASNAAIVYEQVIPLSSLTYSDFNEFTLTTPYTITSEGLVIGYTATFNLTAAGTRYPFWYDGDNGPFPSGAYNVIGSTSATAHGVGATWTQNTQRALGIIGYATGPELPENDLTASLSVGAPLKWVGSKIDFSVSVSNVGTSSQNNYTVQLIDDTEAVLATKNVTTLLVSGSSSTITLSYTPTAAGNVVVRAKVILSSDSNSENDISEPSDCRIYPMQPMAYCTSDASGMLTAGTLPQTLNLAIGYPTANIGSFVGKQITAIDVYIDAPPSVISNAKVWIRSTVSGSNLKEQAFTPTVQGWNFVTLPTPFDITNANTFIGVTYEALATSSGYYPMSITDNTQNGANGGHFLIGTTGTWETLAGQTPTPYPGNWAIVGVVSPVYVTITTDVDPAEAGSVTGAGSYAVGDPVTLTATANAGYRFSKWSTDETDNPLTFNAEETVTYTAYFIEACHPVTNLEVAYTTECHALLTWDAPAKDVTEYNVYRDGALIATEITENSYTDEELDPALPHTWEITVICEEGGESDPVEETLDACAPPCDPIAGATGEVGCTTATLTWTAIEGAIGYKVTGDAGEFTVTEPEYTETGEFENEVTYTWMIVTLCENDNESDPVEVQIVADCEGIHGFSKTVSIYPNPANSSVKITAENFAKVEIYSAIGQLIVTQNTSTVDVSNYQAGVYFFKVFDNNNNTAMKRISVIK